MNDLVKFVEIIVASSATCFNHGPASTGVQYTMTVDQGQPGSNEWFSFIDGHYHEHNNFVQYLIAESTEHTDTDSCSGWSAFAAFGEVSPRWQRFIRASLSWYTVQSSYLSAGCWTPSGGPPNAFYFSH
jgi:hypothetical protein